MSDRRVFVCASVWSVCLLVQFVRCASVCLSVLLCLAEACETKVKYLHHTFFQAIILTPREELDTKTFIQR